MIQEFQQVPGTSLPIFYQQAGDQHIFYTPGCLAGINNYHFDTFLKGISDSTTFDEMTSAGNHHQFRRIADKVVLAAENTMTAWDALVNQSFTPECLTLYAQNVCNLACTYCYSAPSSHSDLMPVSIPTIQAASQIIAKNCRKANKPMTVVFQGGGEPSLDLDWIDRALTVVAQAADREKVYLIRYVATNGVMSTRKAEWIAAHFDLVGISCDGPPEIQNRQRPKLNGGLSSDILQQTAEVIHQHGKQLQVRVTLTPETAYQQDEIVRYICSHLRPASIHVEPVYRQGRAKLHHPMLDFDVDRFVQSFFDAQEIAHTFGIGYDTSSSRMQEIHGPYCHLFRGVLQLIPGDRVVTCFLSKESAGQIIPMDCIGHYDPIQDEIAINTPQLTTLQKKLGQLPERCRDCFNRFHCVWGCPDACILDGFSHNDFRCQLAKQLTLSQIDKLIQTETKMPAWIYPIEMITP